jgi:hypothetical protein
MAISRKFIESSWAAKLERQEKLARELEELIKAADAEAQHYQAVLKQTRDSRRR